MSGSSPAIIDASALVELLLASPRAPAVIQAVSEAEVIAPDHVNVEVLNALRRMERTGQISPARAAEAVSDLIGMHLRRLPTASLLARAWQMRAHVEIRDGCYVAAAQALDAPLVTSDLRLSRAHGLGVPVIAV